MNFLLGTSGPVRPDLPPHLMDEGERAAGLVEKATSDILLQVDWAAMMEVVDAINRASDQAVRREIVRQIRKRLQSRSTRVVHMALELTEAVVKNGDARVHKEVATPKFMNTMARVARAYAERTGKENLEVADKALELIQSWGEAFLPESHTLPLFAETYHVLRKEGLPFRKQYDETKVPVLTPPPSAPSMRGSSPAFGFNESVDLSGAAGSPNGGKEAALAPLELLGLAATSEGMLQDMLRSAQTRSELMANEALPEVVQSCQRLTRALQHGIEARVLAGGSAEYLEEFFAANDQLQAALQLYSGVKDHRVLLPLPGGAAEQEKAAAAEAEKEEDLDDFLSIGTGSAAAAGGGGGGSGKKAPSSSSLSAATPAPGSRTPTPPAAAVPRLAPSRRDSFDKKDSARQSFRRRSGSGGAGGAGLGSDFLLDVASLDITGSNAGFKPASTAGTAFASNTSSVTDFSATASSSLPADPFASGPPLPILPPPRSIASPSSTATAPTASTLPTGFPSPPVPAAASAFLSAPGSMTTGAAASSGADAAFAAFPPPQQPAQQQQAMQPAYGYGSMGGVSGSISSSMGSGYPPQQQPHQPQPYQQPLQQLQQPPPQGAPWAGPDPFAPPTAQQPQRPASYPQPTTATGGPTPAANGGGSQKNPFDDFPF